MLGYFYCHAYAIKILSRLQTINNLVYFQVHNWTVEQTTEWLEKNVELPQYVKTFVQNKVTGATLPR